MSHGTPITGICVGLHLDYPNLHGIQTEILEPSAHEVTRTIGRGTTLPPQHLDLDLR